MTQVLWKKSVRKFFPQNILVRIFWHQKLVEASMCCGQPAMTDFFVKNNHELLVFQTTRRSSLISCRELLELPSLIITPLIDGDLPEPLHLLRLRSEA
jgi:hypothetical protein